MSLLKEGHRVIEGIGERLGIVQREKGLSPEDYRASLGDMDQCMLSAFEQAFRGLQGNRDFADVELGLIAIGSTTLPEAKRHHPVRDIDLRILHSTTGGRCSRKAVALLRERIKDLLEVSGLEYKEFDSTASLWVYPDGTKWLDFYNSCPSFVVQRGYGLPLHICISGPDTYSLPEHLHEERRRRTRFVRLA